MRSSIVPATILIVCLICAGCTGNNAPARSTYTVDSQGVLSLSCAPVTTNEVVLFANDTYTKYRIVLHTESGDVVTYLAAPKTPKAAAVYAPGAGYAFLFIDTRGNGGETPGIPFSQQLIQQDFARFGKGEMPQYYLSICDLISAQELLTDKYHVPVYVIGSSNGGRYAAVAAGVDPQFAGYIGISTSDWGLRDSLLQQGLTGDPVRFVTSLEPSTYIGKISPRPVWIYHNATDPIIPFASGQQFYEKAGEPRSFTEFFGDHGITPDVDNRIIMQWAQIYGNRG
jgi:pimeloyl-ACP methyl ester carboxylesterase